MSKQDKILGGPKHPDERRKDPPENRHKKGTSRKKVYPPHIQVRGSGFGTFYLWPHRVKGTDNFYDYAERGMPRDLPGLLAYYAERCPQTANLPVRFIGLQPIECGREILPN